MKSFRRGVVLFFTVCAIIGNAACFESSDDNDAVKTEFARSVIDDAIESIADEACIPDNPKTDIDIEHDGLLIYVTWEIPQPGVANATFTITFDTYHIRDSHVSGQIEGAFTFTYDPVTKKRLMLVVSFDGTLTVEDGECAGVYVFTDIEIEYDFQTRQIFHSGTLTIDGTAHAL